MISGIVAILGGTGTLGRAVTKILLSTDTITEVRIFSRDEIKQLEMMDDFPAETHPKLSFFLGDIRDINRLSEILNGVDMVIHAAAIKHVVMAEKNPEECYKTNVIGSKNVVEACIENEIRKAVIVSTDKAINPIGVYGRSKLKSEEVFLSGNKKSVTQFRVLRLGNIIGARGSVFEVFERQKKTGTIKVTHPDATRFYISQDEAAVWVLKALDSSDANILTPKMKSFKVVDLAKKIAPECKIEIVGLRPGDKLHEELEDNLSDHSNTTEKTEIEKLTKNH